MASVVHTNISEQLIPKHWYKIKSENIITINEKDYYNFKCSLVMESKYNASIFILTQHIPNHVEYTVANMESDVMYLQCHSYDPKKEIYTIVFSCDVISDDEITLSNEALQWVYTADRLQLEQ